MLLRVDIKCVVFLILEHLQLFSWEMFCAFDHNLNLHFLTSEIVVKLRHFTIGFLCLFCWVFLIVAKNAPELIVLPISSIVKSCDQWNYLVPSTSAWSELLLAFHTWAAFNMHAPAKTIAWKIQSNELFVLTHEYVVPQYSFSSFLS